MRIFLDNCLGHVTIQRMLPYWKNLGIEVSEKSKNCTNQLSYVRISEKSNLPITLRLDGIYYNSEINYIGKNASISTAHSIVNSIVYQSEYCKKACEIYLSKRKGKYSIIYNGIEENWCGVHIPQKEPQIVIASKWRRHKRLKEIIDLFYDYLKFYPKAILHVFGKLHDNPIPNHPNIIYYGHVSHEKMKEIFRLSTLSIHLSKRDACPNSVVEAIGAGCPVITTNACGGATEMCELTPGCVIINGEINDFTPVPHYTDEYNKLDSSVYNEILKSMINLTANPIRVKVPEKLSIEYMAKKYIEIMEK